MLGELDERRGVPDLEPHVQAELALRSTAQLHHFLGSHNINRHGLFAIDVLAGLHDSLQMLGVEVRRRSDDDDVDFFRVRNFLESPRAAKHLLRADGAVPLCLAELVEVVFGLVELVLEQVGQRHDAALAVIDQVGGVRRAAPAAAEQAHTQVGIRGGAPDELGPHQDQAGRRRRPHEFAPAEPALAFRVSTHRSYLQLFPDFPLGADLIRSFLNFYILPAHFDAAPGVNLQANNALRKARCRVRVVHHLDAV